MLNNIYCTDHKKHSKCLGRGSSSGRGKTCGRGNKGQKSRSGVSLQGFEGGQTPLFRRLPKRGFTAKKDNKCLSINITKLPDLIDKENGQNIITITMIRQIYRVNKRIKIIKLIGDWTFTKTVSIECHKISKSLSQKITKSDSITVLV